MNKDYIPIDDDILAIKKENYSMVTSSMINLTEKKLCIDDIKFIITSFPISLKNIIKTQYLTVELCKEYFLDDENKYANCDADTDITLDYILYYQKHLSKNDFYK